MIMLLLRWVIAGTIIGGFAFLVGVGAWTIVMVARMKREQAEAMTMLRLLAARAGLREAIEKIAEETTPP